MCHSKTPLQEKARITRRKRWRPKQHTFAGFQDLHRDSIPGRWTDTTLGKAPHKPLLLICVSDLYREDWNRENRIEPTLYLEELFDTYWQKLFETANTSTFAFPFFHLQHDGFWSLVAVGGHNVSDPAIARGASALRGAVAFARLDQELHELLRRPAWNSHLRSLLIVGNFTPEVHDRLVEP